MPFSRTPNWFILLCLIPLLPALGYTAETPAVGPELVRNFAARPIGPAVMGGRITDIEVLESKPTTFFVAAATGGLWKTTNGGTTWTPLFDNEATNSIGSVAVAASDPDVIYVGTGEANLRNSVSYGDGLYRSADGGKTWANVGLKDSNHIGQIVVHPKDPDIVYVAAVGHAWGMNKERGLYKSTNGGKNWTNTKDLGWKCGFIDVVMDPADPETLYAAAYEVRRGTGSGDGKIADRPEVQFGVDAGIYKTTDGAKTWTKLDKGLPKCHTDRIGLSIYRKDPKVVYAVIQTEKTDTTKLGGPGSDPNTDAETGGVFRSRDGGDSWVKLNNLCPRPFYFSKIRVDPNDDKRVYVLGIALHVSNDGGKTFTPDGAKKVHADHHAMWINPADSDHLILGNDGGLYTSADRGKNWEAIHNIPLAQYYGVGVDMRKPYWVYGGLQDNGTWGGPSRNRRLEGIDNADWIKVEGGDGYRVAVDPDNHSIIYCESQYGRLHRADRAKKQNFNIQPKSPQRVADYRFNWCAPLVLSPHNSQTIFFGGECVLRSIDQGRSWKAISPDLTQGKPDTGTLTALAQSPRDSDVLWAGSADGLLHVTKDGGTKWKELSLNLPGDFRPLMEAIRKRDLDANTKAALAECRIVCVYPNQETNIPGAKNAIMEIDKASPTSEREFEDGRLKVKGTRPGHAILLLNTGWAIVHVISPPTISCIECSHHDAGTAYVAVDRHRTDDYRPYIYKTTDYGDTWKPITSNLPDKGHAHVIREDRKNKDLLFAGTEFGLFVSLDGGGKWLRLRNGLPTVAVNDLTIHPRENELVIGTHGRGVYIMDIAPLQQLSVETLKADSYLFDIKPAVQWKVKSDQGGGGGAKPFFAPNPPVGATISYYLKEKVADPVQITIADSLGKELLTLDGSNEAGIQSVLWETRVRVKDANGKITLGPFVPAGEYVVTMKADGTTWSKKLKVEADE